MSGLFGIVGDPGRTRPEHMAAALEHRGTPPCIVELPAGGFVGVVGPAGRVGSPRADTGVTAAQVTLYRGSDADPLATLDRALEKGPDAVWALDADFAAVRVHRGTVCLARDFFGCAPLYFARLPGALAFASEYKALLAIHGFEARPDREMIQHLQHAKRLPLGRTLLEGVETVLPGTILTLRPDGSESIERAPPLEVAVTLTDPDEAATLIRDRIATAVERRARDLDPIALALSGGIDSITLAFVLARLYPDRRLVTITTGSSPQDPECVTARAVAARIGCEHHEIITPPGALIAAPLDELVWYLEDPYSRSEALQLFEVGRRAAATGCSTVLSGQGADGLFAGMPKYRLLPLMEMFPPLRRALGEFFHYTQTGVDPSTLVGRLGVFAKFRGRVPPVPKVAGTHYLPPPASFPEPGPQFLNRSMARGFQAGVCQDIHKFERGFAAHGVAYRSPFYDMGLVRFAYTIDDALKIRGGQEKWILRRAVEPWVPDEFLDVPKFPQRIDSDVRFAEALDLLLDATIEHEAERSDPIFESETLEGLRRPDSSRPYAYEAAMRIWTAVLTNVWLTSFVEVLATVT